MKFIVRYDFIDEEEGIVEWGKEEQYDNKQDALDSIAGLMDSKEVRGVQLLKVEEHADTGETLQETCEKWYNYMADDDWECWNLEEATILLCNYSDEFPKGITAEILFSTMDEILKEKGVKAYGKRY